jgi:hypothetical protein
MWKFASLILVAAGLVGCADGCGNTPIQTATAPTGHKAAILFERNCGATTDYTTQISLIEAGEKPSGKGNIFIADGGLKSASWGGPWAEMSWLSPGHLLIRYDASARVFEQQESADGVRISFEKVVR